MGQQPDDDHGPEYKPGQPAPAPWEHRQAKGLQDSLQTGGEAYSGVEGEAGHLADDQASLSSKLRGGGRDQGGSANAEYTKLCPACHTVTRFVQGVCSSCGYRDGDPLPEMPAGIGDYSAPSPNPALIGGIITAIVVIALVVLGFIYGPKLLGRQAAPADGSAAPASADASATAETPAAKPAVKTDDGGHAGGLEAITIDDPFHTALAEALDKGSAAWQDTGKDCYAYRYNVFETTVPATSQMVTVTVYLGGKDAAECAEEPGDAQFQQALAPYLDGLNSHAGVNASFRLVYKADGSMPGDSDRYLRYGYWYAKDHWTSIKPIIDNLESAKKEEGQYPESLSPSFLRGNLRTRGGLTYTQNGVGYVPMFKVDGSGNIIMGHGKGLAAFMPEECDGYYLVFYLSSENSGMDLFGKDDLKYYRDKIQPFPYQPDKPVHNMQFNPDGELDGIACVIHSGEIIDSKPE
jgi:hypothetical protein